MLFLRNLREVVVQQMSDVKNSLLGIDGDKDDSPDSPSESLSWKYYCKFARDVLFQGIIAEA